MEVLFGSVINSLLSGLIALLVQMLLGIFTGGTTA